MTPFKLLLMPQRWEEKLDTVRSGGSPASFPQLSPSGLRRPRDGEPWAWAWAAPPVLLSFPLGSPNLSLTWLAVSRSEDIQPKLAVPDSRRTNLKMAPKLARPLGDVN